MRVVRFRFVRLLPFLLAATFSSACADSKLVGGGDAALADGSIDDGSTSDGSTSDGSSDDGGLADGGAGDAGDAAALCPNGVVNPGEACDDGNMINGDGCNNDCTLSAICGNGHLETGEECDDGNNRSGDGCDGSCRIEACGNGRLDAGEVCDGTPGCAVDCKSVKSCGNGTVDPGEQCDDGNQTSWDGCSAACETEKSVAISDLQISTAAPAGCDVNRDGKGDNALGDILGLATSFVGPAIKNQLSMPPFIVLTILGAGDATLANDPNVRIAWVGANDADGNAANDFTGAGTVHVVAATVNGPQPLLGFSGSILSTVANAGPEDVTLPFLGGQALGLKRASLVSTTYTVSTVGTATHYTIGTNAGHLCGTLQVATVSQIPNILGALGSAIPGATVPTNSCSTMVADNQVTMADVFAGGASASFHGLPIPVINGTMPDVDFDGDGLESFVLESGSSCQAVIVACIDGDGTRIDGHACVNDPRIADGWSSAFDFSAANVTFVP